MAMDPSDKAVLNAIVSTIDGVLCPLGFTRRKLIWRRLVKDVLQQFSIYGTGLKGWYEGEWGLNVCKFSEDPSPLPWKLHVRWATVTSVSSLAKQAAYRGAFVLSEKMTTARRCKLASELLANYVVPCFERFQTAASVRRMARDWNHPLRAEMFVGLPDDWWPPD